MDRYQIAVCAIAFFYVAKTSRSSRKTRENLVASGKLDSDSFDNGADHGLVVAGVFYLAVLVVFEVFYG